MNIFPRIKDYKNQFYEISTWADYHQLLSSLWSIVALFLDPVQKRLSLKALKRMPVEKHSIVIVANIYQR